MLSDHISIVLTTNPIPVHPNTDMLSDVLNSFVHLSDEIYKCHLVMIFDGYKEFEESEPKSGRATAQEIVNYNEYKSRAKSLVMNLFKRSEDDWTHTTRVERVKTSAGRHYCDLHISQLEQVDSHAHLTFVEILEPRIGFALGVREGLRLIATPYVLVAQHDWVFERNVPLAKILQTMDDFDQVKYVGFLSKWNLDYSELRALRMGFPSAEIHDAPWDLNLCRLYFWYDRTHVCKTAHYQSLVFCNHGLKRGHFIEDTFGQAMMKDIREGKTESDSLERHAKYGTFLYFQEPDQVYLRHLHGRKYHQRALVEAQLSNLPPRPDHTFIDPFELDHLFTSLQN